MKDAIDELVARSKDHKELRAFHRLHRAHPEILDFLVAEIQLRLDHGFETFSFHSLWQYARWKLELVKMPGETFLMNDHAAPYYSRAITILHPTLNGRAEFRKSHADSLFGTETAPLDEDDSTRRRIARKLRWVDGTALESGWRPSVPHTVKLTGKRRPDIHADEKEACCECCGRLKAA